MSETSPRNEEEPRDAYKELGLPPAASFEEIQKARLSKINEAGDDVIQKAKIEASYDSLLMQSLKARQLGKVSNEALNASKKENISVDNNLTSFGGSLLTRLRNTNTSDSSKQETQNFDFLSIPQDLSLIHI